MWRLAFLWLYCAPLIALLHEEEGWQKFYGRSLSSDRPLLYRGKAFPAWQRKEPMGSTLDTMDPIAEFSIGEGAKAIRITLHNFPIYTLAARVSPVAQVQRWQRQYGLSDGLKTTITSISRGGFIGLFLESLEPPTAILAWSMLLAEEHVRHLLSLADKDPRYREMPADYTIKAVGPLDSLKQYKDEIESFAKSFELIEAIPTR